MDIRGSRLDYFAKSMADLTLSRMQYSRTVTLVFNKVVIDQYQDSETIDYDYCHAHTDFILEKLAMVTKNPDMHYVQEFFDEVLLEDDLEKLPWVVTMTTTDLPRIPKLDDAVVIDDTEFAISMVKPINRETPSIISLLIYPERKIKTDLEFNSISICDYLTGLPSDFILLDTKYLITLDVEGDPRRMGFTYNDNDCNVKIPYQERFVIEVTTEENEYKIQIQLVENNIIEQKVPISDTLTLTLKSVFNKEVSQNISIS